ncbi:hypothetical protein BDV59DRAFT_189000 [Aspergillus ambiguus]|uniref:uncharacterized protein n=1 Tax=Aspergillus ambiguus TaxID=176160 RepID=UPI003CCCF73F
MGSSSEFLQITRRAVRQASHPKPGMTSITNPHSAGRLAVISIGKLQKESSSQAPDLRRCIGHHGIFRQCVIAEQEQHERRSRAMTVKENASCDVNAYLESEQDGFGATPIRSQITRVVRAMAQRRSPSAQNTQNALGGDRKQDREGFNTQKISLAIRTRQRASRLLPGRSRRVPQEPLLVG